jgi:Cu2+-exporting ATPase
LTVEILSGDVPDAVKSVADAVGIADWQGAVLPIDKLAAVETRSRSGSRVLMVGDGLNDTAALAGAHAAMAPGTALDASQNAADLVFTGDSLMAVTEALDVARSARKRALENFGFAALYNAVAAPAAMLGLVNPFIAALAMSGSSLVVTLNALRTGRAR